jgi:hypothetical protein
MQDDNFLLYEHLLPRQSRSRADDRVTAYLGPIWSLVPIISLVSDRVCRGCGFGTLTFSSSCVLRVGVTVER